MAALAGGASASPAAFHLTGEGSAADCLTVAAALLDLPLPKGWRPLAARAAALIGLGAADPAGAAELASLQQEVRQYLKERLGERYPQPRQADGGMEALLGALCTEETPHGSHGQGQESQEESTPLPAYRIALRAGRACGACGWREEGGPERQLAGVQLSGADVAVRDAILHSQRSRFDLQKCLWSCAPLHGGGTGAGAGDTSCPATCPNPDCTAELCEERAEAVALPKWLVVILK